jgi:hypothetical protein
MEEKDFQSGLVFPGHAGFFRCLTRKSRSPRTFTRSEWCYRSVGGGRTFVWIFHGKKPVAGFFGPWPALVGLSCVNGNLSERAINTPSSSSRTACPAQEQYTIRSPLIC